MKLGRQLTNQFLIARMFRRREPPWIVTRGENVARFLRRGNYLADPERDLWVRVPRVLVDFAPEWIEGTCPERFAAEFGTEARMRWFGTLGPPLPPRKVLWWGLRPIFGGQHD